MPVRPALRVVGGGIISMLLLGCGAHQLSSEVQRYQPQAFFQSFREEQLVADSASLMLAARSFFDDRRRWPGSLTELRRYGKRVGRPLDLQVIRDVGFSSDRNGQLLMLITYRPSALGRRRGGSSTTFGLVLNRTGTPTDSPLVPRVVPARDAPAS